MGVEHFQYLHTFLIEKKSQKFTGNRLFQFLGVFDFGDGDSDMADFLHLEEFLNTAQEEDLLALVRPGPYTCAEWEFGGFPSWLLRNVTAVRTSADENFLHYVKRYFNVLLPILALLQFQKGGPIIGFQVLT